MRFATRLLLIVAIVACFTLADNAPAATFFSDNFDSGGPSANWSTTHGGPGALTGATIDYSAGNAALRPVAAVRIGSISGPWTPTMPRSILSPKSTTRRAPVAMALASLALVLETVLGMRPTGSMANRTTGR